MGSCRSTPPEGGGGQDGGGGRDACGDPQGLGVAGRERRPAHHRVAEAGRRRQDRDREQPPSWPMALLALEAMPWSASSRAPRVAVVSGGPNRAAPEATTSSPGSTSASSSELGPMPLSSHSPAV